MLAGLGALVSATLNHRSLSEAEMSGLGRRCVFLYITNMYAVNAVYDGSRFQTLEPVSVDGQYEVVITFLRKIDSKSDMEFCEQLSRNSLKDAWFPGDEDL